MKPLQTSQVNAITPMLLKAQSRLACALAILTLVGATVARASTFDDAVAAKQCGGFSGAFSQFRQLASEGYAAAEFELSLLYLNGKGGSQNSKESNYWLKQAALRGYWPAQSNLGVAFNRGRYLPQDGVKAYIWSSMAANSCDCVAMTNRDVAARKLTTPQLELAKALALECKKRLSEVRALPQCL
ncbi:MAG: tetratricopeptide repeat protein [Rhodoferax sp.]|uniref:tetratricopeptide repeat protein n=1 Tax=Rhodoferax sp. TaxID=50421 RepID=UPI0026036E7B|nr:tetratricopeptide repeat protein [Rhodoferax sp.]MDD2882176.1 tetratricopeptide repeat protein [Rhodoferax sp.]